MYCTGCNCWRALVVTFAPFFISNHSWDASCFYLREPWLLPEDTVRLKSPERTEASTLGCVDAVRVAALFVSSSRKLEPQDIVVERC